VIARVLHVSRPVLWVNDIFDQETDDLNTRKGGLEGARIHRSETRAIVVGIVLTNVPFLAYFIGTMPPTALAWVAAYIVLFVFYSAPPLRFKARRFLDALSNAAYAFPLAFVPLALGESAGWAVTLGLMAWSVATGARFDVRVERVAPAGPVRVHRGVTRIAASPRHFDTGNADIVAGRDVDQCTCGQPRRNVTPEEGWLDRRGAQ